MIKTKFNFKGIIISLIITIGLFMGLLFVEKTVLQQNGTIKVFVANSDIEKGTFINDAGLDKFKEKVVDADLNINGAVTKKEDLIKMITKENLNKGEIISVNSFISEENVLKDISDPVETSFNVADISQVVGGILRKGDMIDISVIDSNTKTSQEVLKSVYVDKALGTDGKKLSKEDTGSALIINIIVSTEDAKKLNDNITKGTIRISKIN